MTNNITELSGSETSDLQMITEGTKSHHLIYKGTKFIYSNPTNGNFIYKCHEIRCPMKIKVDKERHEVLGKAGTHVNHAGDTPSSPRCNRSNGMSGGKITSTPIIRKSKSDNKTKEGDGFTTVIDIDATDPTRDAPPLINETCAQAYKSVINPESHNTDTHLETKVPEQQEEFLFKIRYEEMSKLKDTLIDKIVEKERIIVRQETEIETLKGKIRSIEESAIQVEDIKRIEDELEQTKNTTTKLKTIISTMEAGWEVDKLELEKIKSTPTEQQPGKPTNIPAVKKTQNKVHYGNPKPGPSRITVSMLGDSHVRGLEALLGANLPKHYDVQCHYKPGSRVEELHAFKIGKHTEEDIIVLISGTNDVSKTSIKNVKESLCKFVNSNNVCTIVMVLVPLRRNTNNINSHIRDFNKQISNQFKNNEKVIILDPNTILKSGDYVPDDLHLNKIGKGKLVEMIRDCIAPGTLFKKPSNTTQNKHQQRKVNGKRKFDGKRKPSSQNECFEVRKHNRYGEHNTNNNYRSGYNHTYNRYNNHKVKYYNYNRKYDYYHNPLTSYHQYPQSQSSHYNRTYHNNNRYHGHYNTHTRRYRSSDGCDSERWGNAVSQNRFFRRH
uniref:Uncharacterized protein n=1 Tax=Cacopsylla melanoneura TaxID=428564 RepID=A0A8D9B1H1_9HEMI